MRDKKHVLPIFPQEKIDIKLFPQTMTGFRKIALFCIQKFESLYTLLFSFSLSINFKNSLLQSELIVVNATYNPALQNYPFTTETV